MRAVDEFEMVALFGGLPDLAVDLAAVDGGLAAPLDLFVKGVLVFIDVDAFDVGEVDGIGAIAPHAAEEIGVEDLQRERFPSAGGSAIEQARPRLADDAEALLDFGDQLLQNGVAVGADVDGVHRVGIVEIGRGVLHGDDDHAREIVLDPIGSRCRDRYSGAKRSGAASGEVALRVEHGIGNVGLVVIARQQHGGAEVNRAAPELASASGSACGSA